MHPADRPARGRLEFAVRAGTPAPFRRRLARLEDRLARTTPDGLRVRTVRWPEKIDPRASGVDTAVADRLSEFEAWAEAAGVELAPAFDSRTCYSWRTDERYEAVVLPVASLAVETDDGLLAVYPHVDDTPTTVPEAVEWLATTGRRSIRSHP